MLVVSLFHSFKIFLPESMRKQRFQFQDFCRSASIHHDKIDVTCQIHKYLPARAARWCVSRVVRHDSNCFELRPPLRDGLEYGRTLCTDGERVRADLDIAPGVHFIFRCQQRSADSEMRIGCMGPLFCQHRQLSKLFVRMSNCHRFSACRCFRAYAAPCVSIVPNIGKIRVKCNARAMTVQLRDEVCSSLSMEVATLSSRMTRRSSRNRRVSTSV